MRDNHEGLPELLNTYERDGRYFGTVRITVEDKSRVFEFGLSPNAYHSFRRMISLHPFDRMPGLEYRYFFVPSVGGDLDRPVRITNIRVELGKKGKNVEIEAHIDLIKNLIWFFQIDDFSETEHLNEICQP